ncbi:MAG: tetratricopeptide repeat protein [Bdellovibrionota bacterium]
MKDDSEDALEAAKEGDAGNAEIAQTEAKIAISDGDLEKAKELLAQMESLSQLIAYMNNKAVTLARCGKYEDGIALYKKTINSIPQKHEALRAVVGYNLALAYVRMGEQGEAVEALDEVIEFGSSKVLNKSKSLRHRLEKALETGLRVQLIDKNEEKLKENKLGEELGAANEEGGKNDLSASSSHENKVASGTVKINPGDMCCFRVFDNPANIDARVEKLLHKSPKFNYREAIRRAETGGADMVNAAS